MYLLKLQMHKHGNSIYFMRDNMVCFPKFDHKYRQDIELELIASYLDNHNWPLWQFRKICHV